MNLRAIDLNLLLALDALLSERHVTRAASRVGLSQPAMSNALARLRQLFGDELLIRTPAGMQPTRLALELEQPLQLALRQVGRVFDRHTGFDPATARLQLVLRLSDLLGFLLLPGLLSDLAISSPGITLDVVHLPPDRTVDALERDEVHLAVSMGLQHPASIRADYLFADRMVCIMRAGHPAAASPLTLDRFLSLSHLKVSMSPTDLRFVDDVLAASHLHRKVGANVPHWLLVPQILAQTDLVSVMSGRLASALHAPDLVAVPVPFASEPFAWSVYQHYRYDGSPPVAWLRERIVAAAADIPP